MILLDGTVGEGGGQLLRAALALSVATQQPFTMKAIRAKRAKPGLKRQHLTAIAAAQAISNADVDGAALGAAELRFVPHGVCPGAHALRIGSAGSTTLVMQAVVPALALAQAPSVVDIFGGTHNPLAPPADYLREALAPLLRDIGWDLDVALVRHGFMPAGGGQLRVQLRPAQARRPLELHDRGPLCGVEVRIVSANLRADIGERERAAVAAGLAEALATGGVGALTPSIAVEQVAADGPGNAVLIILRYAHVSEVVVALGAHGQPAERVAASASRQAKAFLQHTAPVSEHLCDQLIVPLALTAGGSFTATTWSPHAAAQAYLIESFLADTVRITTTATDAGVRVELVR